MQLPWGAAGSFLCALLAACALLRAPVAGSAELVPVESAADQTSMSERSINELPVDTRPFTLLQLSILGNNGKDVQLQVKSNAAGKVPVTFIPQEQWHSESAFNGDSLILPSDGIGSITELQIETASQPRAAFAVYNGAFIDPGRYAMNLVSPFSLFCRSDEGAPQKLSTGVRFAFDVPGNKLALSGVLARPFVYDVHYYRLPEGGGFGVSSGAGPNPGATWTSLQELAQSNTIVRLGKDPCFHALPDGPVAAGGSCVPGKKEFPEKAWHFSGQFGATLVNPNAGLPVPVAPVIYGPLSPSPFFNPGERPGDRLPPTIIHTDSSGAYNVPLIGFNGPIEIGVAQGCDEHTTVAIADGPASGSDTGTTTTTTTVQTGGGTSVTPGGGTPSTVAKPPGGGGPTTQTSVRKPKPDEKVCGPDITDWVMGTLEFMVATFNSWNEATKDEKCASLYGLGADGAWDMRLMTPFELPTGDKNQYNYFARDFPGLCGVPPWPCGNTVQFLGVCLDVQIVNYVQWGAVNQMCNKKSNGIMMHSLRDRLGNWKHAFWHSTVYDAQDLMSSIGEQFAASHDGLAARKKALEDKVKQGIGKLPDIAKTDGFDCPLNCGNYAPNLNVLDGKGWGFKWGDDWYDKIGSQLTKP